jgi:hypothetical protein
MYAIFHPCPAPPDNLTNQTMRTKHTLRAVSDALHTLAMLSFMPLCIARILAKVASRFYYSN